jgi:hypothetical protein
VGAGRAGGKSAREVIKEIENISLQTGEMVSFEEISCYKNDTSPKNSPGPIYTASRSLTIAVSSYSRH